MNEEQKPRRKRQANPDRITLSKTALENLAKLDTQVEKAFGGMVRLKNKEMTNFLLEVRFAELTNAELKMIRERYFDEVKAATLALQKLKQARDSGHELRLADVFAQLQAQYPSPKASKRKRKDGPAKGVVDPEGSTPEQRAKASDVPQ